MARIRSVKPEIRLDQDVAGWPRDARLAWIYLWGYLDDEGRGRDDLRLLVAELFPLDRDVTEKKLDGWLRLMASTVGESGEPPLCRYVVDGREYLHAVRWRRHQKISHPTASRIPPCPIRHPSGGAPESYPEASAPRVRADQGSGIKGSGLRLIDGLDLDRIAKRLGIDNKVWLDKVCTEILSKSSGSVENPTAYILRSIDENPARFRPTPTPGRTRCPHGVPPAACADCAEAARR